MYREALRALRKVRVFAGGFCSIAQFLVAGGTV